jgi:hypothetical protein
MLMTPAPSTLMKGFEMKDAPTFDFSFVYDWMDARSKYNLRDLPLELDRYDKAMVELWHIFEHKVPFSRQDIKRIFDWLNTGQRFLSLLQPRTPTHTTKTIRRGGVVTEFDITKVAPQRYHVFKTVHQPRPLAFATPDGKLTRVLAWTDKDGNVIHQPLKGTST